jgi:hypothetical protein
MVFISPLRSTRDNARSQPSRARYTLDCRPGVILEAFGVPEYSWANLYFKPAPSQVGTTETSS